MQRSAGAHATWFSNPVDFTAPLPMQFTLHPSIIKPPKNTAEYALSGARANALLPRPVRLSIDDVFRRSPRATAVPGGWTGAIAERSGHASFDDVYSGSPGESHSDFKAACQVRPTGCTDWRG